MTAPREPAGDPHRACCPPRDVPGSHHLTGCPLHREMTPAQERQADREDEADRAAEQAADAARLDYWAGR